MFSQYFHLSERGSNVRTEILAGLTTFIAMAYCLFVVPAEMGDAGFAKPAVFAATAIASGLATIAMGLYSNLPFALAPGMGITAFFAYVVCGAMHLSHATALGAVFISGIVFLVLTITGLRDRLISSIPKNLRFAISAGIGMFILLIGLRGAGLIVDNPATLIALGDLHKAEPLLACMGVIVIGVLIAQKIPGAILIGVLAVTAGALFLGVAHFPHKAMSFAVPSMDGLFMTLDVKAACGAGLLTVLLTLTMSDLFDSVGTMVGLISKTGMDINDPKTAHEVNRAMQVDSVATMGGAVMGVPTITSYVESAAGIAAGGRTGLSSVVCGLLFLASLILAPLVGIVPSCATAPALIVVGVLVASDIRNIDLDDITEAIPSIITVAGMPFTYNIATGLGLGFISYTILKLLTGRAKEVSILMWVVSALFIASFAIR